MADDDALARIANLAGLPHTSARLQEALTHPSLANERREIQHNQRLEFLGDAILGLCASETLFERFPNADEGKLTRLRAQLVNADALARWARHAGLQDVLRLGRGAAGTGLRESTNALADAVEALIAAAYLDAGAEQARRLSAEVIAHGLAAVGAPGARDPKSELQEWLQALGRPAPVYELLDAVGPAHERWFRVRVLDDGEPLAEGSGRSKRAAEQAAAELALKELRPSTLPQPLDAEGSST
jgi:ribonuclease-3